MSWTADDLGITNVLDYVADIPDTVPWAAEPFAYYGGVSMLAGIWKGGKSTLMAQLALGRESGGTFLGNAVDAGPTLLLTEESGFPVKRKVRGLTQLDILDRHTVASKGNNVAGKFIGATLDDIIDGITFWAMAEHRGQRCMVIIDTLAVWGGIEDENDATETTEAIRRLKGLAATTGAAVIVIHHSRKEGGTHGRAIRGSGAIAATVDVYAILDYVSAGPSTSRSLVFESRVTDPIDMTLTYDPESATYAIDTPDLVAEYESWLAKVPTDGNGMNRQTLTNLWDVGGTTARRRIAKLLEIGRMRERFAKHPGDRVESFRYWAKPPAQINVRGRKEDPDHE
jgi:hypothetical protein